MGSVSPFRAGAPLPRRAFLRSTALGTAALCAAPALRAAARAATAGPPLYRVSLAEWSLHRKLRAGTITNLDFPVWAATHGFEGVEYVNSFFRERAKDRGYLGELKRRCAGAGVRSLLIMCDGEGALGDPDEAARNCAVENHLRWLDAARFLGCHAIRVNAASAGSWEEQRGRAADGLRRLAEHGEERGLDVIVENHGGLSSNGAWLAEVMRAVDHPRIGTLPDFGNFRLADGSWYDRYRGVAELMPFARAVSAKSHAFGPDGEETGTDYARMMRIVLDAGYRGFVGVEYEGSEHSEEEGIRLTRALLLRLREELAPEYAGAAEAGAAGSGR